MTRVLAFVPDLMDRSRIGQALADASAIEHFSTPAALWAAVDDQPEDMAILVVVDLARPRALDAMPTRRPAGVTVVGFGPHVDEAALAEARAAGVDEVLPRSRVFRRLPEIVRGLGEPA